MQHQRDIKMQASLDEAHELLVNKTNVWSGPQKSTSTKFPGKKKLKLPFGSIAAASTHEACCTVKMVDVLMHCCCYHAPGEDDHAFKHCTIGI